MLRKAFDCLVLLLPTLIFCYAISSDVVETVTSETETWLKF